MLSLSQTIHATPVSNDQYCQCAIALKKNIEVTFLVLGEMLKSIRDERKYEGAYSSFEEYVAELEFTESRASKLISVYDFFVATLKIPEEKLMQAGGWSNLYEVYQLADGKPDQENFVNETLDALGPVIGGRQKLIRQMKKGIDPITCTHSDTYTITCCRTCGERMRDMALEGAVVPQERKHA